MAIRADQTLNSLESVVLERIAQHRAQRKSALLFSIAAVIAVTALTSGVLTGISAHHRGSGDPGSEAALLADDVGLAPSSLLASN